MKILVVEDEARIASFIRKALLEQGFTIDLAGNGEDGLHLAITSEYDLVILDVMLPIMDGITVLRELRAAKQTPVILLTARNALDDRVQGLNEGADDYLTKPFYVEELVARVHAVARRRTSNSNNMVTAGAVSLNRLKRETTVNGRKVTLTAREFNLLEYLMRSPGNVYTRTQILEKVWEYHFDPKTNIIDVYVQRIRTKLAEAGAPDFIETIRGVGYRIKTGEASQL